MKIKVHTIPNPIEISVTDKTGNIKNIIVVGKFFGSIIKNLLNIAENSNIYIDIKHSIKIWKKFIFKNLIANFV